MKNIFILLFILSLAFTVNAQVETPAPSPFSKVEQTAGLTDITIEYSRPSVKERTIFAKDGLVPFGKRWRTGANAVTKITFSNDVSVEGQELAQGTYVLMTTPDAESWGIHFFELDGNYPGGYDDKEPFMTVDVEPVYFPEEVRVESFMIMVGELRNNSATLQIVWDNVYVPVKLDLGTDDMVFSSIDKVMAGPSHNDYYSAARYYRESGKDLATALSWMDKSIELRGEEKFWVLRQKSLIQADMGDYSGAIKTAEKSLALATEAENMDYVKMNNDSMAEWKKMKGE